MIKSIVPPIVSSTVPPIGAPNAPFSNTSAANTAVSFNPHDEAFSPSLYGGKGSSLMMMAAMGIPVPVGFILPIGYEHILSWPSLSERPNASNAMPDWPNAMPDALPQSIELALQDLEKATGKRLGDPENPLFVSVRSGGAISMPGMMDTFLNIGLNPDTCLALSYRLGWSLSATRALYAHCEKNWAKYWSPPGEQNWAQHQSTPPNSPLFSQDSRHHLWQAIQAVWKSSNSARAVAYKKHCGLADTLSGSAVIIQSMVFGNGVGISGTGVLFTRRPDTGENTLFGEFLAHAQGEALVSGSVTPLPLSELAILAPKIFDQLCTYAKKLEFHLDDMQDIEFTFENDTLWILQTRSGKRTASATFRIAYDRVLSGESTKEDSILGINPMTVDALLYPHLKNHDDLQLIGQGLPTSSGAAIGYLTTDIHAVTPESILLRTETSAEDVPAMLIAGGVITLRGGMTSHAAVIMRSIGKPCISGLKDAFITEQGLCIGGYSVPIGTCMTMDGSKGLIFQGKGHIETLAFSMETHTVLSWADSLRHLNVYANADTPHDVALALKWGADGIGLCRSEHMMFEPENLQAMQQCILLRHEERRQNAMEKLELLHTKDLLALLHASQNHRFVLRLLDPPLHEFLPSSLEEKKNLAQMWSLPLAEIDRCIAERTEINPMMGLRGCRLGLAFPELYSMQIRALFNAMDTAKEQGLNPHCGIMVPLVSDFKELQHLHNLYQSIGPDKRNVDFGVMIETPRAAIIADQLTTLVDFISFGTNDLTQMTWGLSRDDSTPITRTYQTLGIPDPFSTFDSLGVGALVQWACIRAKQIKPNISLSICGEHGAYPENVDFFQANGITALSCSPWALPRIRLAAAKASILEYRGKNL